MPKFRRNNEPGPHYIGSGKSRQLIRPGEVIECEPEDLGSFAYKFDPLDPPAPKPKQVAYLKKVQVGKNAFDVVPVYDDETIGDPINDQSVTEIQADAMIDPPGVDIVNLDLPKDLMAALENVGYTTVDDIKDVSDEELLKISGVNKKNIKVIRAAIEKGER